MFQSSHGTCLLCLAASLDKCIVRKENIERERGHWFITFFEGFFLSLMLINEACLEPPWDFSSICTTVNLSADFWLSTLYVYNSIVGLSVGVSFLQRGGQNVYMEHFLCAAEAIGCCGIVCQNSAWYSLPPPPSLVSGFSVAPKTLMLIRAKSISSRKKCTYKAACRTKMHLSWVTFFSRRRKIHVSTLFFAFWLLSWCIWLVFFGHWQRCTRRMGSSSTFW